MIFFFFYLLKLIYTEVRKIENLMHTFNPRKNNFLVFVTDDDRANVMHCGNIGI